MDKTPGQDDQSKANINTATEGRLRKHLEERLVNSDLLSQRQAGRHRFSPDLSYGRHFSPPFSDSKPAAVMILLEKREHQWSIPLTVRPQHLPDHPGQISFPGGRIEGEELAEQAAIREFEEELGVAFSGDILGELQALFVYNSNYAVRPFVAIRSSENPSISYDPCVHEVERLIHLPITTLTDVSCHPLKGFQRGRVNWKARVIQYRKDQVWGATAIMLGELAACLEGLG